MEEKKTVWTDAQRSAIEARDTSLVVSAAAGSGKTSVMTERIVRLLAEDGEGRQFRADRLAVVTFTKAAVKGLEDKLYHRLSKLVAQQPENTKLSRQLMALSRAQISTIHSLCFSLIRTYHNELGLPSGLRIGDDTVMKAMKLASYEEAVERFLSECEGSVRERRESLARVFGTARSLNGLCDALEVLFKKCASLPGGIHSQRERLSALNEECRALESGALPFHESLLGKEVAREAAVLFRNAAMALDAIADETEQTQFLCETRLPTYRHRAELLQTLAARCEAGELFESGRLLLEELAQSLSRKGCGDEKELKEALDGIHNFWKEALREFCGKYLSGSLPEILAEMRQSLALAEEFMVLAEMAEELYTARKRKKNLLDYTDLEQLALCLVAERREDGSYIRSEVGRRISEDYDAVFVDEYQDTNRIQDLIFRCISREDNLFIVGDPKQSIYRFRGAAPEIFSDYKSRLPRYPAEGEKMQTVFLSHNFRCAEPVIDLVNRVFRTAMSGHREDSLYRPEDELQVGNDAKRGDHFPETELILMAKRPEEDRDTMPDHETLLKEENVEAKYIAGRIRDLLPTYAPEKIAVLCRTNQQLELVRASLERLKIPCSVGAGGGSLSDAPEFLFLISLLGALDNPLNDVSLLGTMLSPVFRFSADELYCIRKGRKHGSFYQALTRASRDEGFSSAEKAARFLETLGELRARSKNLTLPALIFDLYQSLSVAQLYGAKTGAVKEFFLKCAATCEENEGFDLAELIRFAKKCAEEEGLSEEDAPGVRVMTMHNSKGLEFPVVFASFLGRYFETKDESSKLILTPNFGPAFHLPVLDGKLKVDTCLRRAAAIGIHREMLEEEKRILYVAMTRAETKLILTGNPRSYKSLRRDLMLCCERELSPALIEALIARSKNQLGMLLVSLANDPAVRRVMQEGGEEKNGSFRFAIVEPAEASALEVSSEPAEAKGFSAEELLAPLAYEYRSEGLEFLPKKLSVSQLLRAGRTEEEGVSPERILNFRDGSLGGNAARIGTATHQVMQFASFEALARDPKEELARLVEKGFLTEEDAALVRLDEIEGFFRSPLYDAIAASSAVVREKRFNVLLPAMPLLGKEGEVMVQGVVDAWFEDADGQIVLVDFKTDRVTEATGEDVLTERHAPQLRLYARAVEAITGKQVSRLYLYSFALGRAVPVER